MLCIESITDEPDLFGGLCNFGTPETKDINFDVTYQLLISMFDEDLINISATDAKVIKFRKLNKYLTEFNETFNVTLYPRSPVVKELYFLYQTSRALDKYNQEKLHMTYRLFRSKIYFPNMMYLLIRLLPYARKFFQDVIRKVYLEFYNRSNGLINVHINSFYIDQDVIKSDVLYEFLGNGIKKQDPLEINSFKTFYCSYFRSIFQFYLKRKKDLGDQDIVSIYNFEDDIRVSSYTNRISMYRDVLFNIHIKKVYQKIPVLCHLSYNFQIFKNVIVTNEFQNLYQSAKKQDCSPKSNEYRLIDFYDDEVFEKNLELFNEVKQLPIIYRLLRCVHILSPNLKPYNEVLIKPDVVKQAVYEELLKPFKNLFLDEYILEILMQISSNFVNNILTGEYINLMTFSSVKINHLSFIDQVRKFVKICLM